MAFPRRAIAITALTAFLFYIFSFPFRASVVLCVATFLVSGRAYLRLFIKTFPRDLWYVHLAKHRLLLVYICYSLSVYRMGKNLAQMLRYSWMHKRNRKLLSDLFEEQVKRYPDKPAIIFTNDDRTWTYLQLNDYANQVANYFSRLGLQKGDTASLFLENSPEYIGLYLGLWKIGVVAAFVNYNLRHESLTHCIRAAKSRVLVFSSSLTDAVSDVYSDLETSMDAAHMIFAVCGDPPTAGGGRSFKTLDRELQGVSSSPPPELKNKSTDGIYV